MKAKELHNQFREEWESDGFIESLGLRHSDYSTGNSDNFMDALISLVSCIWKDCEV